MQRCRMAPVMLAALNAHRTACAGVQGRRTHGLIKQIPPRYRMALAVVMFAPQ